MSTASWVIVARSTGKPVFETFSSRLVAKLNADQFEAVPVADYLGAFNAAVKTAGGSEPEAGAWREYVA